MSGSGSSGNTDPTAAAAAAWGQGGARQLAGSCDKAVLLLLFVVVVAARFCSARLLPLAVLAAPAPPLLPAAAPSDSCANAVLPFLLLPLPCLPLPSPPIAPPGCNLCCAATTLLSAAAAVHRTALELPTFPTTTSRPATTANTAVEPSSPSQSLSLLLLLLLPTPDAAFAPSFPSCCCCFSCCCCRRAVARNSLLMRCAAAVTAFSNALGFCSREQPGVLRQAVSAAARTAGCSAVERSSLTADPSWPSYTVCVCGLGRGGNSVGGCQRVGVNQWLRVVAVDRVVVVGLQPLLPLSSFAPGHTHHSTTH